MLLNGASILLLSVAAVGASFWLLVSYYRSENLKLQAAMRSHAEGDARYHAIFENAPMGCIVWEPGFKVVEWNRQAERIFGWSRVDMLGKSFLARIVPQEAREAFMRDATDLFVGGPSQATVAHTTRDRRRIVCDWHHSVQRSDDGMPLRIVSLCLDVTAVKGLRRENALFRDIIDLTESPAIILLDGADGGRIVHASESACRQLGRTRAELVGATPAEWEVCSDPQVLAERRRMLSERKTVTFETQHRREGSGLIPVEVTANLIEHEGQTFVVHYCRDISERLAEAAKLRELEVKVALRRQYEEELLERSRLEARMSSFFANAPGCFFTMARDSRGEWTMPFASPGIREAHGLAPDDDAEGLDAIVACVLPDDAKRIRDAAERAACELTPCREEYRVIHPSGETRWVEARAMPQIQENGSIVMHGFMHDISERKRMEQALQRGEDWLRRMYVLSPLGIARTDATGRFVEFNEAFRTMTGYSAEELRQMDYWALTPPEYAQQQTAELDRATETGRYGPYEKEYLRKDGTRIAIRINGMRIAKEDGQPSIWAYVEDISRQRQIERNLQDSLSFARELIEVVPDPVFYKGLDGRYLGCNAAFERLVGKPRAQIIGGSVSELWPEDLANLYAAADRSLLDTPGNQIYEATVNAHERRDIVFHRATFTRADGSIAGIVGVAHDVTALKHTERRLNESRGKLEKLSARREAAREEERKRIARDLHEELGQLLTALRMDISTLPIQYGNALPALRERSRTMLGLVDKTIRSVRDVVAALRPTALDAGIEAGLSWLTREFSEHMGVRCELSLHDVGDELGDADATAVFRIVQEALTNVARHAGPTHVVVGLARTDAEWQLEVRDAGRGFDPNLLPEDSCGILGMQERAAMLGGTLEIASADGQGCTVQARFPVRIRRPHSRAAASSRDKP